VVAAAGPGRAPDSSPFELDVDYPMDPALSRLPRGRHGLPRELVEHNHRNRLLAGTIEAVAQEGYLACTVADITTAAGVSRGAFYHHFNDKQACFLAAYDLAVQWIGEVIAGALNPAQAWPEAVWSTVARTLDIFAADSRLARLCTIEILFAGAPGLVRFEQTLQRLAVPLAAGRAECSFGAELPCHLEPTLIGGAISLVSRRLNAGEGDRLPEFAPELTEFLLAPYLGTVQAAQSVAAQGTSADEPVAGGLRPRLRTRCPGTSDRGSPPPAFPPDSA
jgi:AcrR family transcriptional regulator